MCNSAPVTVSLSLLEPGISERRLMLVVKQRYSSHPLFPSHISTTAESPRSKRREQRAPITLPPRQSCCFFPPPAGPLDARSPAHLPVSLFSFFPQPPGPALTPVISRTEWTGSRRRRGVGGSERACARPLAGRARRDWPRR